MSKLTKAGDVLPGIVTKSLIVTPSEVRLMDAAAGIRLATDPLEIAYMARELVQCTLPHSDPGKVPSWSRTNGALTLIIGCNSTDKITNQPIGCPYGSIPRLLLFWLTSEAIKTNKRRLELGKSLSVFMEEIGLSTNSGRGKRSNAKRLRDQMARLFRATISFDYDVTVDPRRHGFGWLDMQIAPRGALWWDPKRPDQNNLWESWIELGEYFFNAITAAPVPLDTRALRALKKSPLALDLYAWATHKAYTAHKGGKNQRVPWAALKQQFGGDYDRLVDFVIKAKAALKKIQIVYPGLQLEYWDGGVTVKAESLPAVLPER